MKAALLLANNKINNKHGRAVSENSAYPPILLYKALFVQ